MSVTPKVSPARGDEGMPPVAVVPSQPGIDSLPENSKYSAINQEYLSRVQMWLEVIQARSVIADVFRPSVQPLKVEEGAKCEPLSFSSLTNALQKYAVIEEPTMVFRAGCPFFWVNHLVTPATGVSIHESDVDDVVKMDFGPLSASTDLPASLRQVRVALLVKDIDQDAFRGSLRRFSPCEFAHAAIKRCYQECQADWFDDTRGREWAKLFQSVEFEFWRMNPADVAIQNFRSAFLSISFP